MKYTIRPFKYGLYDYRDAEILLNEMSQKGWEFKTTSKGWLRNWAMFEKAKDEKKSTYNIDLKGSMTDREKEEYHRFYADLGWQYQDTYNKKLNIFKANKSNNISIYSEEQAEYENFKEYGTLSTDMLLIIQILLMASLIYFNLQFIGYKRHLIVTYGVIVALTIYIIDATVILSLNMIYRSSCKKNMEKTGQLPENVLLKKWRVWEFYSDNLLILIMCLMPIFGFGYEIWGRGIIPKNEVLLFGKEIYFAMALVGFFGMFLVNYFYMVKPDKKFLRIIDFIFDFSCLFAFMMYLQCLG